MKGLLVTSDNQASVVNFEKPLYKSLGNAVGGFVEVVRPGGLRRPFCMIVNDCGAVYNLPINVFGSVVYGVLEHGSPIHGDIVIMKEGMVYDELDFIGLNDEDVIELVSMFNPDVISFH